RWLEKRTAAPGRAHRTPWGGLIPAAAGPAKSSRQSGTHHPPSPADGAPPSYTAPCLPPTGYSEIEAPTPPPPTRRLVRRLPWLAVCAGLLYCVSPSLTQSRRQPDKGAKQPDREKGPLPTSYDQVSPVLLGQEGFQAMMAKDKADKPAVTKRQEKLL